jgi:hypothetical protein
VEDVAQLEQEQVHITRWGVGTEHELNVMHERLNVKVSSGPFEGVSLSSDVRGVASSRRRSVPR